MPDTPNVAILRQINDDLTAVVSGLSPEQLAQPSACAGWDVAQVLGHLGAAVQGITMTVEATAAGQQPPGPEAVGPMRARWDEMTPEQKRDEVLAQTAALVETMASADPELRFPLRFAPVPLSVDQLAGFMLIELGFHTWDARMAFDPEARLFAPAVPALAQLIAGFLGRMTAAGKIEGAPVLGVDLADPPQSFGVVLGDPLQRVDSPAEPDAVLRGNTEDWLLMVMGRAGAGTLDVSGALALDQLRSVFAGV